MFTFIPDFIPDIVQITPVVLAFCYIFSPMIRKQPGAFYLALTVAVVFVSWFNPLVGLLGQGAPSVALTADAWFQALPLTSPGLQMAVDVFTSSHTGVAFYLVVMFIGALEPTPAVKRLLAIRTEMSIMGGIIICAHCLRVVELIVLAFDPQFRAVWGEKAGLFMFLAYAVVGSVLTVIFFILWITSFKRVRMRFSPGSWKKLQRLAYPFMALTCIQGVLIALSAIYLSYPFTGQQFIMSMMIAPQEWLATFAGQVATAVVYAMLGITYLVMRVNKHRADSHRRAARQARRIERAEEVETS